MGKVLGRLALLSAILFAIYHVYISSKLDKENFNG